jgi:hypothetical protein
VRCTWCQSPILEQARIISDRVSVHAKCLDLLEEKLKVIPEETVRRRKLTQTLLYLSAA